MVGLDESWAVCVVAVTSTAADAERSGGVSCKRLANSVYRTEADRHEWVTYDRTARLLIGLTRSNQLGPILGGKAFGYAGRSDIEERPTRQRSHWIAILQ